MRRRLRYCSMGLHGEIRIFLAHIRVVGYPVSGVLFLPYWLQDFLLLWGHVGCHMSLSCALLVLVFPPPAPKRKRNSGTPKLRRNSTNIYPFLGFVFPLP